MTDDESDASEVFVVGLGDMEATPDQSDDVSSKQREAHGEERAAHVRIVARMPLSRKRRSGTREEPRPRSTAQVRGRRADRARES